MFYTEIELTHFEEIERMLSEEFKSPLTPDQATILSALLADPIQPIPDHIKKPDCYPKLMASLHSESANIQILTRVAVALVMLTIEAIDEYKVKSLRDLIIKQETQFNFEYKFVSDTWSFPFIKALATILQSAPALTNIDCSERNLKTLDLQSVQTLADAIQKSPALTIIKFSCNTLGNWDLLRVQALADAFQHASKLREIHLESNNLDLWHLPRVQAFANAIQCAPVLEIINLSFNDLSKWNVLCIQALANAIRYASRLREINFSYNDLGAWDLPCVEAFANTIQYMSKLIKINLSDNNLYVWELPRLQALANAIQNSYTLTTIDLSLNDLGEWDLPRVQVLANAIHYAPQLKEINLSLNYLVKWDFPRIQALVTAIENNFLFVSMPGIEDLPKTKNILIQRYLDRNKKIKTQIEQFEQLVHQITIDDSQTPKDLNAEPQQINEVYNKTLNEIYNEIINLELILQAKTPSANHYLARLQSLRFNFFERSWNSTHENDSPNASQDFLEALPWCLDANSHFIACNEQQQKVFDACLAKALGIKLILTDTLRAEQRISLLKCFYIHSFNSNYPTAQPVAYSPTFHPPASATNHTKIDAFLTNSAALEKSFDLLSEAFLNSQHESIAMLLYDAIKHAEANLITHLDTAATMSLHL